MTGGSELDTPNGNFEERLHVGRVQQSDVVAAGGVNGDDFVLVEGLHSECGYSRVLRWGASPG